MKTVDVYQRYYKGFLSFNTYRHGVSVKLTAETDNGMITYEVSVNFFPHKDEEDFAISYDACYTDVIYSGKGRRSKKREEAFLKNLKETADALAKRAGGLIYWDKPLSDEKRA